MHVTLAFVSDVVPQSLRCDWHFLSQTFHESQPGIQCSAGHLLHSQDNCVTSLNLFPHPSCNQSANRSQHTLQHLATYLALAQFPFGPRCWLGLGFRVDIQISHSAVDAISDQWVPLPLLNKAFRAQTQRGARLVTFVRSFAISHACSTGVCTATGAKPEANISSTCPSHLCLSCTLNTTSRRNPHFDIRAHSNAHQPENLGIVAGGCSSALPYRSGQHTSTKPPPTHTSTFRIYQQLVASSI